MDNRVYIYDSTLRDGSQSKGVDFNVADKIAVAHELDALGVDYIEGGWPGANPTDDEFFATPPALKKSRLTAFGMTRRQGRSAANDPALNALFDVGVKSVCMVGKASEFQVTKSLGVSLNENLKMISDSFLYAVKKGVEVLFDAEHFFDGYKQNKAYAIDSIKAAYEAGARWIVLCDTNGGSMPFEIAEIVSEVTKFIPGKNLGIHCHNDTENAVANSLAAVAAGVRQVQGTINGVGERCGNANLISIIPSLMLKMGYTTGISPEKLTQLTHISRALDDRLNRQPNAHAAYVGSAAFAHKGGLHASAIAKNESAYEHINPEIVGNTRTVLISDKAGKSNIAAHLIKYGISAESDDERISALLKEVKNRENEGYAYEGAEASFELLARSFFGGVPDYFNLQSFRVLDERRINAKGKVVTLSEATVKVIVGGELIMTVAEGNGPVNALDSALRKALAPTYPTLSNMRLIDYKVRILTPGEGTKAVTRVLIESTDSKGNRWNSVGVSGNVIAASYNALFDAINYNLLQGETIRKSA